jgi:hypothetical protein
MTADSDDDGPIEVVLTYDGNPAVLAVMQRAVAIAAISPALLASAIDRIEQWLSTADPGQLALAHLAR